MLLESARPRGINRKARLSWEAHQSRYIQGRAKGVELGGGWEGGQGEWIGLSVSYPTPLAGLEPPAWINAYLCW